MGISGTGTGADQLVASPTKYIFPVEVSTPCHHDQPGPVSTADKAHTVGCQPQGQRKAVVWESGGVETQVARRSGALQGSKKEGRVPPGPLRRVAHSLRSIRRGRRRSHNWRCLPPSLLRFLELDAWKLRPIDERLSTRVG